MRKSLFTFFSFAAFAAIAVAFCACSSSSNSGEGKPFETDMSKGALSQTENVSVVRLDSLLFVYDGLDSEQRKNMLKDFAVELDGLRLITGGADAGAIDTAMVSRWAQSAATVQFMPEVNKTFANIEPERAALRRIVATAAANGLTLPATRFATVAWGDRRSIIVIDSLRTAYIALNHYLGAEHPAYAGWADYQRALKGRNFLAVDVAEALTAIGYPYTPGDNNTVLSRLLYEGALAVAKQAMVPDATLAEVLGLSEQALDESVRNEGFIWKHLTANNNLFSKDAALQSNLFDLRPNSSVISGDAPGRAARLTGYRIVSAYVEKNPDVSLAFLLSPAFYTDGNAVLRSAGYNP